MARKRRRSLKTKPAKRPDPVQDLLQDITGVVANTLVDGIRKILQPRVSISDAVYQPLSSTDAPPSLNQHMVNPIIKDAEVISVRKG